MRATATRWTLIEAARGGDTAAQRAFAEKYRAPVLAWLDGRGLRPDEAEDVAQEVFLRLFAEGVLERADPARGRFRALLLAVTRHVHASHVRAATAAKRGGGAVERLGELDPAGPAGLDDDEFARDWLLNLLDLALRRLEREHPRYHEAIELFLLEGGRRADVARAMGRTEGAVRNYVHRGKRKLASYVREEAWSYSSTREECVEELGALARLLGDRGAVRA